MANSELRILKFSALYEIGHDDFRDSVGNSSSINAYFNSFIRVSNLFPANGASNGPLRQDFQFV